MSEGHLDPELTTEGPGGKLNGRVAFVTGGTRVVHFLAADASSYITGQVWGVNGGLDM